MSRERVLVVRVGAMGDVLHALPAVRALRQAWPDAAIEWVVDPRWAPLLVDEAGLGAVVSRVHWAETRLWSRRPLSWATARSVLGLRAALEAGRYTHVVDVQGTLRSAVIGRMAGNGDLAGFDDPREALAGLFYTRTIERRGTHVVEQNAALLGEALGLALEPIAPVLPAWRSAELWADQVVAEVRRRDRVALLAPAAGWGAKQWPGEHFAMLARALGAMGFEVLINAGGDRDLVAEAVANGAPGARLLACDVAQLVAMTRRAALVIGGDSGPVHLAAALGRPVVALFGPTDPARNGPWGAGLKRVLRGVGSVTSHRRVTAVDAGLAKIGVGEVVAAVEEL